MLAKLVSIGLGHEIGEKALQNILIGKENAVVEIERCAFARHTDGCMIAKVVPRGADHLDPFVQRVTRATAVL